MNINLSNEIDLPPVGLGEPALVSFTDAIVSLGFNMVQMNTKKIDRAQYSLRLIRKCTTDTLRIRLLEALVIPHLRYDDSAMHVCDTFMVLGGTSISLLTGNDLAD